MRTGVSGGCNTWLAPCSSPGWYSAAFWPVKRPQIWKVTQEAASVLGWVGESAQSSVTPKASRVSIHQETAFEQSLRPNSV